MLALEHLVDDAVVAGRWAEADRLLDQARAATPDRELLLAVGLRWHAAQLAARRGDRETVQRVSEETLAWSASSWPTACTCGGCAATSRPDVIWRPPGRVPAPGFALLRGDLDAAATDLRRATELAERDHWLFFLPWPQALVGEIHLERGEVEPAAEQLQQAFARAAQLGDPCWEGMATRGLALVAAATGETDRAFAGLVDARSACHRYADPYVWLDAYVLDALCALGRRHDHPQTRAWAATLTDLASRTGMRELTVRALRHTAALGDAGAAAAARLLAADIDNPALHASLAADPTP